MPVARAGAGWCARSGRSSSMYGDALDRSQLDDEPMLRFERGSGLPFSAVSALSPR
ncbi:hypothetical protein ACFPM0_25230 [Pseudonocardia sulfidoxydans]|uniref:hypothetical protein n=1 Tax=Pseudonocardia sulfidoxydans TaxID=54011 RepID=UPI00360888BF